MLIQARPCACKIAVCSQLVVLPPRDTIGAMVDVSQRDNLHMQRMADVFYASFALHVSFVSQV